MNVVLFRIVLSFFIAGIWITGSTLLGERLGSQKAGLITNLPSNILISLLFMAITKGSDYAASATAGIPIGMTIDTVFLLVFIILLPRGLWRALVFSLLAWAASAIVIVRLLPPLGFGLSIVIYLLVMAVAFLIVDRMLAVRKVEKKPAAFSLKIVAVRAFFAGSVVAGAVAIAQVAPPYMTGVLATFPAVLTSTMVILTRSQGSDFARATGKILILSSSNIILYAACAGILFPKVGPWWGTLAAFSASLIYIRLLGELTKRVR